MQADVTGKIMDSMQRMADLNLNLARATFEHANFAVRQLMSAEDAQAFLSLAAAQIRPNATRAFDYGYYLAAITADAQVDVIKAVGGTMVENNRELLVLAEDIRESAPCAFREAAAYLRSVIDSIAYLYAEIAKTVQTTMRSLSLNRAMQAKCIAYTGHGSGRAVRR
jgi:phasin family protein